MSAPTISNEVMDRTSFPIGGRPLEWRALEEARAFESWFARDETPAARYASPGRMPDASRVAAAAIGGPTPSASVTATAATLLEEASPSVGPNGARHPEPMVSVSAFPDARPSPIATRLAGWRATSRSDATAPSATVAARAQELPRWSRVALTTVLAGREVRIWLRDYGLAARDAEQLRDDLARELHRLGCRLAIFVLNGERHALRAADLPSSFV